MSIHIRKAKMQDSKRLSELMAQLSRHEVSEQEMMNRIEFVESSPFDSLYVWEENERIYGVMSYRIRENIEDVTKYGEISSIVVDQEARRKGVGRQLMEYADHLAKEQGCIGTWLVSGFGREEEAHQFYKDLGFNITGYRFVKKFR
ncbi:GNAT family N-acetyltransferase [Brevibacillus sp. SYSU BS000544]|uniref:GNAT family N-acetyltransferase n=1 Tax=Brevibacillus sp. SYSU BS000544 TaxID=3416443 RepID=UPI003CE48539